MRPGQRRLAKVLGVSKQKDAKDELAPNRQLTVQQLTVLLYHFYIGITDPDVYYVDAEETADQMQQALRQTVEVPGELLEKLLWYLTVAEEQGMYWNPEGREYNTFVRELIQAHESYDKLMGLIINRPKRKRLGGLV